MSANTSYNILLQSFKKLYPRIQIPFLSDFPDQISEVKSACVPKTQKGGDFVTWEILELISTNRSFFIRLILTLQVEYLAPFLYERLQRNCKYFKTNICFLSF